jgi:hypothetical protein
VANNRFSAAFMLDALPFGKVFLLTVSATLQRSLFLLELLRIHPGKTNATATTPRTGDLAGLSVQVRDNLARAVAWHAGLGLVRLLGGRIALAVTARRRRRPAGALDGGGLTIV